MSVILCYTFTISVYMNEQKYNITFYASTKLLHNPFSTTRTILLPNCNARLGNVSHTCRPILRATFLKINFSPCPLGKSKLTIFDIDSVPNNSMTFSSKYG